MGAYHAGAVGKVAATGPAVGEDPSKKIENQGKIAKLRNLGFFIPETKPQRLKNQGKSRNLEFCIPYPSPNRRGLRGAAKPRSRGAAQRLRCAEETPPRPLAELR